MRLTNRKTYSDLKNNAERLQAKGMEVSISDLMYIKLAKYENAEEDADVQPVKHGKWEFDCGVVQCSCCKLTLNESAYGRLVEKVFDYCPNCGARMDGDIE